MLLTALVSSVPLTLAALLYFAVINPARRRRNHDRPVSVPAWAKPLAWALVIISGVAVLMTTSPGGFLLWLIWAGLGGWVITQIFGINKPPPVRKKRAPAAKRASASAAVRENADAE